eukprot:852035_1
MPHINLPSSIKAQRNFAVGSQQIRSNSIKGERSIVMIMEIDVPKHVAIAFSLGLVSASKCTCGVNIEFSAQKILFIATVGGCFSTFAPKEGEELNVTTFFNQ